MTYGYIRVSTREQNEDRQLIALSGFDISRKNLFMDKQSGKDFNRPAYRRLLKKLKPGAVPAAVPAAAGMPSPCPAGPLR